MGEWKTFFRIVPAFYKHFKAANKTILIGALLFNILSVVAQINIQFNWGNLKIEKEKFYPFNNHKDSLSFRELALYISNIKFEDAHGLTYEKKVHLLKLSDEKTQVLFDDVNGQNSFISFNFGLDSLLNTNMEYSGALDPVHGMYWAWNTGYIHFKISGIASNSSDKKRKIEYHLGGYKKPYNTSFPVRCVLKQSKIILDLKPLFEKKTLDPKISPHIMEPGKQAQRIIFELKELL